MILEWAQVHDAFGVKVSVVENFLGECEDGENGGLPEHKGENVEHLRTEADGWKVLRWACYGPPHGEGSEEHGEMFGHVDGLVLDGGFIEGSKMPEGEDESEDQAGGDGVELKSALESAGVFPHTLHAPLLGINLASEIEAIRRGVAERTGARRSAPQYYCLLYTTDAADE